MNEHEGFQMNVFILLMIIRPAETSRKFGSAFPRPHFSILKARSAFNPPSPPAPPPTHTLTGATGEPGDSAS